MGFRAHGKEKGLVGFYLALACQDSSHVGNAGLVLLG